MVASSEYNALALPAMETRRNNLVFTFLMKWLCYSRLSVFVTAKGFLKTWLVLWKIPDTVLVRYATIIPKPTMLFSLPASIRFYLPLSPGVDIRGGEREIAISGLPFSEILRLHLRVLHLVFAWLFPVIDQIYFEITKHIKSIRS